MRSNDQQRSSMWTTFSPEDVVPMDRPLRSRLCKQRAFHGGWLVVASMGEPQEFQAEAGW